MDLAKPLPNGSCHKEAGEMEHGARQREEEEARKQKEADMKQKQEAKTRGRNLPLPPFVGTAIVVNRG